jgi:anaerobic selenocysteine-containing dehydrogenase
LTITGAIRDAIQATYPDVFRDFNKRMWQPGGFPRPLGARERKWNTKTGKANFIAPTRLSASTDIPEEQRDVLQLTTLRSNDQFNTTIYGYTDRYRGGTRMILFISGNDMERLRLSEGEMVGLATVADDGVKREVHGLRATRYDIPEGCCASYYPECNPLIPLWHHAEGSHVPAAKAIPVRVVRG